MIDLTYWLTNFSTSELQKLVRTRRFFNILTCKCVLRHIGVPFLDIGTSKSGPSPQFFNILTCKCASHHSGVPFFQIATSKNGPRMWCFVHFIFQMCFRHSGVPVFDIGTAKIGPKLRCFVQFDLQMCATAVCHFSCLCGRATSALASLLFEHQEPRTVENRQRFATFRDSTRALIFFLVTLLAC